MNAAATLVTFQEFVQLPEPDDQRIELIGGKVVSMDTGRMPHEVVKKNLNRILTVLLAQKPIGDVFCGTMYQLDDHNAPIPDLSVLFPGRIQPGNTGWFQGAPEIAIEVISSESAAYLNNKIELYLAHGSKSVWAVFPELRAVRIYGAAGQSVRFKQNETLEDPCVLPGFQVSVSALFADI